ncbi:MAG: ComEC/Rec2 family competence protein, partial [Bdellovibrionota bacterium]
SGLFGVTWSRLGILIGSGAATLFFCKSKNDVLSLSLSWTASTALFVASRMSATNRSKLKSRLGSWLKTHITAYAVLWVPLLTITIPHPASILCNLFLSSIIGLILFPMSLLTIFVSPLAVFTDILWSYCLALVEFLSGWMPTPLPPGRFSASWLLIYIGVLSISLFIHQRTER